MDAGIATRFPDGKRENKTHRRQQAVAAQTGRNGPLSDGETRPWAQGSRLAFESPPWGRKGVSTERTSAYATGETRWETEPRMEEIPGESNLEKI